MTHVLWQSQTYSNRVALPNIAIPWAYGSQLHSNYRRALFRGNKEETDKEDTWRPLWQTFWPPHVDTCLDNCRPIDTCHENIQDSQYATHNKLNKTYFKKERRKLLWHMYLCQLNTKFYMDPFLELIKTYPTLQLYVLFWGKGNYLLNCLEITTCATSACRTLEFSIPL